MIYTTGDTHGEVSRFEEIHAQHRLPDKDIIRWIPVMRLP